MGFIRTNFSQNYQKRTGCEGSGLYQNSFQRQEVGGDYHSKDVRKGSKPEVGLN